MKGQDFDKMSNEELLKNQKSLKIITTMLAAALLVLFIINIFMTFKKGFSALNVVPIALLPILIINIVALKKIKQELKSRNL